MFLTDILPTSKHTQNSLWEFSRRNQWVIQAPCYFQNINLKLVHLLNTEIAKRNPQRHSLLFQAATFPFSQSFIIREVLHGPGVALNTEAQLQRRSDFFSSFLSLPSNAANIAFSSLEGNSWIYVLKDFPLSVAQQTCYCGQMKNICK